MQGSSKLWEIAKIYVGYQPKESGNQNLKIVYSLGSSKFQGQNVF